MRRKGGRSSFPRRPRAPSWQSGAGSEACCERQSSRQSLEHPVLEREDFVRALDQPRIVGREDEGGRGLGLDPMHQVDDQVAGPGVEVGGGLVGQDQRRALHEGTTDGDALALSSTQLVGESIAETGKPDLVEHLERAFPAFSRLHFQEEERVLDVLVRGEDRDEVEGLEDEADVSGTEVGLGVVAERQDVHAADLQTSAGGNVDAGEQVEERRLAASRGSDHHREALSWNLEAHAIEGQDLDLSASVPLVDPFQPYDRRLMSGFHGCTPSWLTWYQQVPSALCYGTDGYHCKLNCMARAVVRKKRMKVDDQPMRQRILSSASRAFAENGYVGTGTREIAARARVSKRELYALFGDKRALLTACVMTRVERIRPPADLPPARTRAELAEQLTRIGIAILREVGAPEAVAMIRLAVIEAEQSPEVASAIDGVRTSNHELLARIFETAQATGLVGPGTPMSMASQYLGLLWRDLLLRLLLRSAELPSPSALEDRARSAAQAVLALHEADGGA